MADLHTLTSVDILRTQCQFSGFPLAIKEDHDNRVYRFWIDRGERGKLTGWFQYASPSGLPLVFDNFEPPILCSVAEQLDSALRQLLRRGPVVGVALEDAKPIPGTNPPQYGTIAVQLRTPDPAAPTICGFPIQSFPAGSVLAVRCPDIDPLITANVMSQIIDLAKERDDLRFIVLPGQSTLEAWDLEQLRRLRDRLNEVIYDKERSGVV